MDQQRQLYKSYIEIRSYFDELIESKSFSEDHISNFWKNRLNNRENFPKFNELVVFRREHASSIGYDKNNTIEKEMENFLINYDRASINVPEQFLIDNQESLIGNPFIFSKERILSSSAGLNNTVSAYWALSALNSKSNTNCENVLEIGAGYGGVAELIIRNKRPKKYVVCDLPHNLYLTAFYLSANYPEYDTCFLPRSKIISSCEKQIILCTPEVIQELNISYDFIINTYSFQEMKREDILLYFDYISRHISDKGIFYFLNTFGAAGAIKPNDYPFQKFDVLSWTPAKAPQPNFFLKRQHTECVMEKKIQGYNFDIFDNISYPLHLLFFAGLGEHLKEVCSRLFDNSINKNDIEYFKLIEMVICNKYPSQSCKMIEPLFEFKKWKMITFYLKAILYMILNRKKDSNLSFEMAIDEGLSGLSKSRALIALAILNGLSERSKTSNEYICTAIEHTPQYKTQLQNIDKTYDCKQFIQLYKYVFPNMEKVFGKKSFIKNILWK